jgi:hypothetical protein
MHEWKKELDLLVEETMAFVQSIGADASKTIDFPQRIAPTVPQTEAASVHQPMAAEVTTPKDRLDRERDVIQKRVANFKANQKKFQKDREEYYTRTMATARAQWISQSRDNDKPLTGPSG